MNSTASYSPASHVRPILAALEASTAAGWIIAAINDGGDEWEEIAGIGNALERIFTVDDSAVGFDRYNEETGRTERAQIMFTLANEATEVIYDNTMNLEPVLAPLYGVARMF